MPRNGFRFSTTTSTAICPGRPMARRRWWMSIATATSISSPAARTRRRRVYLVRVSRTGRVDPPRPRRASIPRTWAARRIDVDGDGWLDHVAAASGIATPGSRATKPFERIVFDAELAAVHDLVVADLDRRRTASTSSRCPTGTTSAGIAFRQTRASRGSDTISAPGVHAGVAIGDIDGDGDLDIARSNAWFENADGKGATWIEHAIPFGNPQAALSAGHALRHRRHQSGWSQRPGDDGERDPRRQDRLAGKCEAARAAVGGARLAGRRCGAARRVSLAGRRRFRQGRRSGHLHGRDGSHRRRAAAALVHLGKRGRQRREVRRAGDPRQRTRRPRSRRRRRGWRRRPGHCQQAMAAPQRQRQRRPQPCGLSGNRRIVAPAEVVATGTAGFH